MQSLILEFSRLPLLPERVRPTLMRRAGVAVGNDCVIRSGLAVVGGDSLAIDDASLINRDCFINASAGVSVGTQVEIASHVRITTVTHEIGEHSRRAGADRGKPVVIGDGCWLGTGVVVLPGVTIGAGTVISAGAVVAADCEPDSLYAGVPAVLKRSLPVSPHLTPPRRATLADDVTVDGSSPRAPSTTSTS